MLSQGFGGETAFSLAACHVSVQFAHLVIVVVSLHIINLNA